MTEIRTEPIVFNTTVQFNILPTKQLGTFPKTVTTPYVTNLETWKFVNIGAVTVTNFLNGSTVQTIKILGDGNTTIANNTTILTNTGANKLLAVNKVYRFTLFGSVWIEDS